MTFRSFFIFVLKCSSLLVFVCCQPIDECPDDPNKMRPMRCGCGIPETDSDSDGVPDCQDLCPNDPTHSWAIGCGCGQPETDSDNDGYADCRDACPNDPLKHRHPGFCGCGFTEIDSDNDGRPDCDDDCPFNPTKLREGQCGCGEADIDTDGDGVMDCLDQCPFSPVTSAYCGTFLPCDDLQCTRQKDRCVVDNPSCETAILAFNSGQCVGKNAQQCWSDAGLVGFATERFKDVLLCHEDCQRLGQCQTNADCQNGGVCYSPPAEGYDVKFCKCPDEWLGWDCSIATQFDNVMQVDDETGEVNMYFSWTLTTSYIYFQWKCRGSVWCATQMGAEDFDIMNNAYPIVGTVKSDGRVYMDDTVSNGEPTADRDVPGGTYDLEHISGWMDGEFEVFRCRVQTDTGDFNDWVYEPRKRSKASWAYGTIPLDLGMDYHGLDNREFLYLDFSSGIEEAHQIPEPATQQPDDLFVPGYNCIATLPEAPFKVFWTISDDLQSIDIAFGGSVPDSYWFGFAFAPELAMDGGDAVIALINGQLGQYDLVSAPRGAVLAPRSTIYETSTENIDGFKVMKFSRELETSDQFDMTISLDEPTNILWSFGPDIIPDGHTNRGYEVIDFSICNGGGLPEPQTDAPVDDPETQHPTGAPIGPSDSFIWATGTVYEQIVLSPGEFVTFDFYPRAHDVFQFPSEEAYESCDFSNAIMLADTEETPFTFEATADQSGTVVYIGCSVPGHCYAGQKLTIRVTGSAVSQQPEVTSRPQAQTTEPSKDCVDSSTWLSVYGDCSSYAEGLRNHQHCDEDIGIGANSEILASVACRLSCSTCLTKCNAHSDCDPRNEYCDVKGNCFSPCSGCLRYGDPIDGVCPPCADSGQINPDSNVNVQFLNLACGNTVTGSTRGHPDVFGDPAGDSVFRFNLNTTETVLFDACRSTYDTYLYVLDETFSNVLCDCDDCGGCGTKSALQCRLEGPSVYFLVIGGYDESEGDFYLDMICPTESQGCCVGGSATSQCAVVAVESVCDGISICSWNC